MTEERMLPKYVIAFNGPSQSGKDYGAVLMRNAIQAMAGYMQPQLLSIAHPLKRATHELWATFSHYGTFEREETKDTPTQEFFGLTPREAYIKVSEEMVKPVLGEDFFGRVAANIIKRSKYHLVHIITDCGFVEEMKPIIDVIGGKRTLIIELVGVRDGRPCTFENDSRGYIGDACKEYNSNVNVVRLPNNYSTGQSPEMYQMMLTQLAKEHLKL